MGQRVGEWQVTDKRKKQKKNPQIILINNSEYAGIREEEEEKHNRKGLFHHNAYVSQGRGEWVRRGQGQG